MDKDDLIDAQLDVLFALEDGNARPLVDYLRNGGELDSLMREHLAAMLGDDGDTAFIFKVKAKRPGGLRRSTSMAHHTRKMKIGFYLERRVRRYGRGGYDSALAETKSQFAVGKTTVENAHKYVKRIVEQNPQFGTWDDLINLYPDP